MNKEYIYESKNNQFEGNEAIIILPDIYGQTDYSKQTVEKFAEVFHKPVFILDYFFPLTGIANNLSQEEQPRARELMGKLGGEEFAAFFENSLDEISHAYPEIQKFIVIGFCFGGRLAYIAGGDGRVSRVFSFYGAGPHTPNYVFGKTPIEYLVSKRTRSNLQVDSFFGVNDTSIPESDRQKIKEDLKKVGIVYEPHEYNAGHAYFQEGRKNYDAAASRASWEVLQKSLS